MDDQSSELYENTHPSTTDLKMDHLVCNLVHQIKKKAMTDDNSLMIPEFAALNGYSTHSSDPSSPSMTIPNETRHRSKTMNDLHNPKQHKMKRLKLKRADTEMYGTPKRNKKSKQFSSNMHIKIPKASNKKHRTNNPFSPKNRHHLYSDLSPNTSFTSVAEQFLIINTCKNQQNINNPFSKKMKRNSRKTNSVHRKNKQFSYNIVITPPHIVQYDEDEFDNDNVLY